MPVTLVFACGFPIAQRYRQKKAWKVSFLPLDGNMEIHSWQRMPQDQLVSLKRQKGNYALCSVLSNNLQSDLSKRIACYTLLQSLQLLRKSSMKPRSGATACPQPAYSRLWACTWFKKNGWHTSQGLTIGKPISQYASYSAMFCPLHSNISKEQHEKHLCYPSSHYEKYRRFTSETRAPYRWMPWM